MLATKRRFAGEPRSSVGKESDSWFSAAFV